MPLFDMIQDWSFGQTPAPIQPMGILNSPGIGTAMQPEMLPQAVAPVPMQQSIEMAAQRAATEPVAADNGFMQVFGALADSDMLQDLSYGLLNGRNWGQAATMAGNRTLEMAPERRKEARVEQQTNQTKALLEKKYPQYLKYLDAGYSSGQVMQLIYEEEQTAAKEAKAVAQRQQLAQLLPEGPSRDAVLAGADFNDVYKAQMGGGTSDWSRLNDGVLLNQRTGETRAVEGYTPELATPPSGYQWAPGGASLMPIPNGPEDPANPLNAPDPAVFNVSQAAAAGFADRMAQSNSVLTTPAITQASMDRGQMNWAGVPLVGNNIVSPEYRQADQAKRDFINATLRRESGAVISPEEFANANLQYFPQPGDDANTLRQKEANRRNTINGVSRAAGPAYETPDTTNYLSGDLNPPAQPVTEQDFNSLPSGSEYIDPDNGQLYRKP